MTQSRDAVLEHLKAFLALAQQNQPQFALLQAAAGLGKSHLLRNFAQSLPPQQAFACASRGFLTNLLQTLHPMLHLERDSGFLEAAHTHAPTLPWAVVADQPKLEPEQMWAALARAVQRLAVRLGGLVLLLEDIHDQSGDDVTAMRFLYRQWLHAEAPILLVASTRPSLNPSVWEGIGNDALLGGGATPNLLEIGALDHSGVQHLAEALLSGAAVPPEFVQWLFDHSEGHPLHATELVRYLLSGGAFSHLGATWQFRLPPTLAVPIQLEALLLARLEAVHQEPETWRVLTDVALTNSPKSQADLVLISQQKTQVVQRALRRLTTLGLLRLELLQGQSRYAPTHPLYPPLLEGMLSQGEYEAAHLRAMLVQTVLYQKANHARAANHESALELTRAAWLDAKNHYAWSEVQTQGLAMLEMDLEAEEQSDVLFSVGDAQMIQGRYEEAIKLCQKSKHSLAFRVAMYCMIRLVRDRQGMALLGDEFPTSDTSLRYFWTCFPMRLGMQEVARERLASYKNLEPKGLDDAIMALYSEHWWLKIFEPHRLGRQVEIFDAVEQLFGDSPDHVVFNWLSDSFVALGQLEAAQEIMDKVLAQYRVQPNDSTEANYLVSSAKIAFARGDLLEARAQYLAALRVASASHDPIHQSYAHFGLYCTDFALGLETKQHLERYHATNAAMEFARYDAPTNLEIAWREAAHQRQPENLSFENVLGNDILAAARLWLLEGRFAAALELLQTWTPETWQIAGQTQTQARPAEHAMLEGLALHFLGKKKALSSLQTARELAQTKLQQAEVELALSLVLAAPSAAALERLQHLNAMGVALFLRRLFVGALESIERTAETQRSSQHFIRTLGVFALERESTQKPWKAQKARELLALLICASLGSTGSLSREQILDTVWQDNDPTTADGAFRVTLSRLRESLGDAGKIERDAQGRYALLDARLDVSEFLKAIAKRELEQAVAWYGGAFLPTSELEASETLRQKLHHQWREAMLQLAVEQGEQKAVLLYEKLLESDPLDIEAVLGLGKTWRSLGGDLRLMRLLEQSQTRFVQEVGETPPELEQMLREVRAGGMVARAR